MSATFAAQLEFADQSQETLKKSQRLSGSIDRLPSQRPSSQLSDNGDLRIISQESTLVRLPFAVQTPVPPSVRNSDDQAFILETGDKIADSLDHATLSLLDPQSYTCYYAHYFYGKDPFLFLTHDRNDRPVFISIERKSPDQLQSETESLGQINLKVLVRTTRLPNRASSCSAASSSSASASSSSSPSSEVSEVDDWSILTVPLRTASSSKLLQRALSRQFSDLLDNARLTEIPAALADAQLFELEEKLVISKYKFAVMYCAPGQSQEDEMLQNQSGSQDFQEFLDFLGTTVQLRGYTGFKGDLDVKNGTTGETSVSTSFKSFDIMFHVSTLLQYTPGDPQQLSRKRYMGNDVVMIIFQDGEDCREIDPSTFRSHFNHIFLVVRVFKKLPDGTVYYYLNTASKKGVRHHEPKLPYPPIFERNARFRAWLLHKLINSQRAALKAPSFAKSLNRTREELMIALAKDLKAMSKRKEKKKKGEPARKTHSSEIAISGPTKPVRHVGHIGQATGPASSSSVGSIAAGFETRGLSPEFLKAMQEMQKGESTPPVAALQQERKLRKARSFARMSQFVKRGGKKS